MRSVFGDDLRSDGGRAPVRDISFEVYVPRNYDATDPPGVMVFISPVVRAKAPDRLNRVFDEQNLIWISVNESGDASEDLDRMLEAYGGLTYVLDRYAINHRRRYLAGFDDGARVASLFARDYPQFFTGYAFFSDAEHWRDEDAAKTGALDRRRFSFVVGAQDQRRIKMNAAYESFKEAGARDILLIEVDKLGRRLPPAREFGEAIDFLDADQE